MAVNLNMRTKILPSLSLKLSLFIFFFKIKSGILACFSTDSFCKSIGTQDGKIENVCKNFF